MEYCFYCNETEGSWNLRALLQDFTEEKLIVYFLGMV